MRYLNWQGRNLINLGKMLMEPTLSKCQRAKLWQAAVASLNRESQNRDILEGEFSREKPQNREGLTREGSEL